MKPPSPLIRAAVAALALLVAPPVAAQMVQNTAHSQVADDLSRYLRAITENPRDLNALIGAGEAALALGDVNAAVGFFGRAEEIDPRNGRAKAGLARVMLRFENPREALRLFDDATDYDVPDIDVAGDRGLAYDLRGDTKRAQRDYQLALSRGPDDEITRRYALSLGISGDRDKALALLDPLLYKRDQGAWRARAFVLAMTGDQRGANEIVRRVLPEQQAGTMQAFLARLPGLRAAQKAMAVHLGRFPTDRRRVAQATPRPAPAATAGSGLIPTGAPLGTEGAERARIVPPAAQDPRQRPETPTIATLAAAEKPAPAAERPAPQPEAKAAARHWVQVAGGANRDALPREWRRVTAKAPALFEGKTAWTMSLPTTNRLLAGPFASASEAQGFVNALRKEGIGAFAWRSEAGQEIEKLPLR